MSPSALRHRFHASILLLAGVAIFGMHSRLMGQGRSGGSGWGGGSGGGRSTGGISGGSSGGHSSFGGGRSSFGGGHGSFGSSGGSFSGGRSSFGGGGSSSFGGSSFGGGRVGGGSLGGPQTFGGSQSFGGARPSTPSSNQFSPSTGSFSPSHGSSGFQNFNQGNSWRGNVASPPQAPSNHIGSSGSWGNSIPSGSTTVNRLPSSSNTSQFLNQHGSTQSQFKTGIGNTSAWGTKSNSSHQGSQFLQQHNAGTQFKGSSNQGWSGSKGSSDSLGKTGTFSNKNNGFTNLNSTKSPVNPSNSFLGQHHTSSPKNNQVASLSNSGSWGSGSGGKVNSLSGTSRSLNQWNSAGTFNTNGSGIQNHHNTVVNNFHYGHRGHCSPRFWYGFGGYGYGFGAFGPYGYGFGSPYFGFGYPYPLVLSYSGPAYRGIFGYTGFGYGNCFLYRPVCAYQPLDYYGYGYGNVAPGLGIYSGVGLGLNGSSVTYSPLAQANALSGQVASNDPASDVRSTIVASPVKSSDEKANAGGALPSAEEYGSIGETSFKARDYKSAVRAWRHRIVDDPENGVLVLMMAQGLFATEQFNESAGATQFGMQLLPKEKWGVVVENYRDLYGRIDDYTTQLRSLEKQAKSQTEDPSLRFLLGYHYGFLGYPKEAVNQLEKCVKLAPDDEIAAKLLDHFQDKLPKTDRVVEPPAPGSPPKTDGSESLKLPPLSATVPPRVAPEPAASRTPPPPPEPSPE